MPSAIGIARISANTDTNTVTWQQVEDAEVHRRGVGGDPVAAVGEEVLLVAAQRRDRAPQQEHRRSRRSERRSGRPSPRASPRKIRSPDRRPLRALRGVGGWVRRLGKGAATTSPDPASVGFGVVTVDPVIGHASGTHPRPRRCGYRQLAIASTDLTSRSLNCIGQRNVAGLAKGWPDPGWRPRRGTT